MKCLEGECVPDYVIEKESPLCKPGQEADDDQDGIPNNSDSCYNPDCAIVDNRGCPKDTDRDGLNNCEDDCPNQAGSAANNGCPAGGEDRDGDGVSDDQDACYNPGCTIIDELGCPRDADADGLPDCDDDCPGIPGEIANNGCPVEEQVELEGTVWNLDTYRNSQGSLVSLLQNTEITAQFQNGTVGGSSGCNSYSGDYTISGNTITIGPLSITLMYCTMPNGIMAQEGDYIAALKSAKGYKINGNTLILTNAVGDVVLVFTAV
jgi:heat shock protein HslJ